MTRLMEVYLSRELTSDSATVGLYLASTRYEPDMQATKEYVNCHGVAAPPLIRGPRIVCIRAAKRRAELERSKAQRIARDTMAAWQASELRSLAASAESSLSRKVWLGAELGHDLGSSG